jgi:hypothetical protein
MNATTTVGSVLLGLLAMGMSIQAQNSDGATTFDPQVGDSIPTYPALPPNSDDIVYDSGNYSGQSRNLQNADVIPGWPYWAHQVRFTLAPDMKGQLLEVRYVAASQWGTTTDFELIIRDPAGDVIATLPGLTAVIDSANWQVIDVSSLNLTPLCTGSDFYLELQPASQCNGDNGFTIAYSSAGSSRSAFSSDCTNPFNSFALETRDLFIRAVVELIPVGVPSSEVTRLGTPPNPNAFLPGVTTGPIVGDTWDPVVSAFLPGAILDFVGVDLAGPLNVVTGWGTLLIDVPPEPRLHFNFAPGTPFAINIPYDCALIGMPIWTQGGSVAPGPSIALANGLDVILGTY